MRDRLLHLDVDTPALLLDLTTLEQNIARMAEFARASGIALRPHAKTHKSAEIAKLQMQAGAIGICCAKLSEAERLADSGVTALLITSSIVGRQKLARLARLYEQLPDLMVVADSPDVIVAIGSNMPRLPRDLPILVDVDVGLHRSGVVGVEAACNLAQTIERTAGLRFAGIQGYAGHVQQICRYSERCEEANAPAGELRSIVEALAKRGIACPIVTGGGTGTHDIDAQFGIYSDLQVGSYVFMDVEYLNIEYSQSGTGRFQPSLFVISQVVSASQPDHVTIDAGSKSLSFDGPMPRVVAPDGSRLKYELYGDEFGKVGPLSESDRLRLGDKVLLLTPHCDPTVNLHDRYVCVRNSEIVAEWEIQARGCAA
jgi:3-hydroxy-D-aspartate aldolase